MWKSVAVLNKVFGLCAFGYTLWRCWSVLRTAGIDLKTKCFIWQMHDVAQGQSEPRNPRYI